MPLMPPSPIIPEDPNNPGNGTPQDYAGVPQGQSFPVPQLGAPAPMTPPATAPAQPVATGLQPGAYTQETVNRLGRLGVLTGQQGDIEMKEGQELADKEDQDAQEKIQRSQDYQRFLGEQNQRHDEDHNRILSAYQDYAKQAGNLKDPSNQFFDDHGGFMGRLLAGFGAFASGVGAGKLGQGGNPFLTYVNNMIEKNFEQHKQNIRDLYDKQVAAGKISDDDQTWSKYLQEARVKGYDIASQHIISELGSIKSRATGQLQKNLADQTINGLEQQGLDQRLKLGQYQAAQQAAALAQQRARIRQVQEDFTKSLDRYKDYSPEQARSEAFKDLKGMGYNRSDLAALAQGMGAKYNTQTEQYDLPASSAPAAANGDNLVPTTDPVTGRLLKPEEREKLQELVVTLPDGTRAIANNTQDAEAATRESIAVDRLQKFHDLVTELQKKIAKGTFTQEDRGRWDSARTDAITSYNAAQIGSNRATGQGESKLLGEEAFPDSPTAAGTATGIYYKPDLQKGTGQLEELQNTINNTKETMHRRLRSSGSSRPAPATTSTTRPKIDFTPAGK